jgi:hypothetical protein
LGWFAVLWGRRWALDHIAAIGEVADMAREQLFQDWERLCDQVRHPALHPALFLAAHEIDEDEELLEVEDDAVWAAVDGQQRYLARVRRGALIAAANVALDRLLGDLTRLENGDRLGGEELFVEDHLPPRYRSGYDRAFHLKLVASAAKVGFELTNPYGDYPACTAKNCCSTPSCASGSCCWTSPTSALVGLMRSPGTCSRTSTSSTCSARRWTE